MCASVKWRLPGLLYREWRMCKHCLPGKPDSDDRVMILVVRQSHAPVAIAHRSISLHLFCTCTSQLYKHIEEGMS